MATIMIDDAFQYENKAVSHPSYRTSKVIPQNNSSIILGSSILESQIEIPQRCYNLSKSTLDFQLQYVSAGVTGEYTNMLTLGQSYIDSIFLKTREGLDIVSLYNVDVVTRAVAPYINKMEKYLTNPRNTGSTTAALAQGLDQGWNMFRSNTTVTIGSTPGSAVPYAGGAQIDVVTNTAVNVGTDSYNEPQYYEQSAADTSGKAASLYRNFSIPLGSIAPHTLLSLDKTLYFGQALILTVRWAQTTRIGFISTATNLSTGIGALDGVLTVANLQLRLAVEQNQPVIKELVDRVNKEGMSLTIPYSYAYVMSVANATAASTMQQRYNRSHGKKLLNIYTFIAATSSNANLSADISNFPTGGISSANLGSSTLGDSKVLTTNPSLNSVYLTEYVQNEYQLDTYETIKPIIKGCAIGNAATWVYNRVYPLSWRQGPSCEWIEKDDVNDGLDLDVEANVALDYTHPSSYANSAALREFQVAVTQRTLTINPGGTISLI